MIEITIPYWFEAAILCIGMVCGVIIVIAGGLSNRMDIATFGLFVLFGFDVFSAMMSFNYMNTPTNDSCCPTAISTWNVSTSCVYPTINPYEQQPLHPLLWTWQIVTFPFNWLHGAVEIKQGVV
jgi:hypothetical protein